VLKDIVKGVSTTNHTPDALAGTCALGILSAAIGKGLIVKSMPNMTTSANLYLLAGAKTGSGKSGVYRQLSKPLVDFEHGLSTGEIMDSDVEESGEQNPVHRAAASRNSGDDKGEVKRFLRLTCENITSASLGEQLSQNRECMSSLSADGRDVAEVLLGRFGGRPDEGIYLKAFSEDPVRIDRKKQPPIVMDAPHLACMWLMQPDKIAQLFAHDSLRGSGFLCRFLVCQTNCQIEKIDRRTSVLDQSVVENWGSLIKTLLTQFRLNEEREIVKVDKGATEKMDEYFNSTVDLRKQDLAHIAEFAARWGEQAWRLALVLHAALWGEKAHSKSLSASTAESAITLTKWFADCQIEILDFVVSNDGKQLESDILHLCAINPKGIKAKDIYRSRLVANSSVAIETLENMVSKGLLSATNQTPAGGGKITRIFSIIK
jgi:hypothetical protein